MVSGKVDLRRPGELGLGLQRILGDVHQHRARPPARSQVERLVDGLRNLVGIGDEVVVLGDRHCDAADVRLLEGVGPDRGAGDLAGDGHQGDRVHMGISDRRDEVGGSRSARRHAHAHPTGRTGVSLGGVTGRLFVADQDVPHFGGVHQGVVRGKNGSSGDSEDDVRLGGLEGPHQGFGSGDLLAHVLFPVLSLSGRENEKPSTPGWVGGSAPSTGCVVRRAWVLLRGSVPQGKCSPWSPICHGWPASSSLLPGSLRISHGPGG